MTELTKTALSSRTKDRNGINAMQQPKLVFEDEDDLDEITSGVKSGLKSWLTFGTSMSGQKEQVRSISESEGGHGPGSRLRVMFRSSTAGKVEL